VSNRNIIAQELKKIKDKHGITTEEWSKRSSVPVGTINRYINASIYAQNFPYTCALLESLGEPIEPFYRVIANKTETPADALKLDAIPVNIGDIHVDTPDTKAEIQERIIVQTEELQSQKATIREKDAAIELLEAKLDMLAHILEEKERVISQLEDLSERRLKALQALCVAY
jgi:hypothetical protein